MDKTQKDSPDPSWRWFWAALAIIALPMLASYFRTMMGLEHYQFLPFVLISVGALAHARMSRPVLRPRGILAWSLIVIAVILYLASIPIRSPWLAMVGFVCVGMAFLYSQQGPEDATLLGAAIPLVMLVRLPVGFDQLLILRLQSITSRLSSVLLDFLGVAHMTHGNVLQLAGRELFVAEACSGIQSVFTLAFIACLCVAYYRRKLWLLPLYLLAAVFLAVIGNVARVSLIAVADTWFARDLSTGWPHEMLGYAILCVATLLLWSFDFLIVCFFHRIGIVYLGYFEPERNPLIDCYNWLLKQERVRGFSWSPRERWIKIASLRYGFMTMAVCLVVATSATALQLEVLGREGPDFMSGGIMLEPPVDLFSDQLGHLEVKSHESSRGGENPRLGKNANQWHCQYDKIQAEIVVSQTYLGWHEFCHCYKGNDWNLIDRTMISDPSSGNGSEIPIAYATFYKAGQQHGYLFYSAVGATGEFIYPPEQAGRLAMRLDRLNLNSDSARKRMAMVQLWVPTNGALPEQTIEILRKDFFRIRQIVAREVEKQTTLSQGESHDL